MEIRTVTFVRSAYQPEQMPDDGLPEVAFAGRSNVGKSSLINRILNRRALVKVSSRPGKTQALNYFLVNESFYLVDLPGYGFAKVSRQIRRQWQDLIDGYLERRAPLRAVVLIIDIRHPAKKGDLEFFGWLRSRGIPVVPVYTKIDKISRGQWQRHAAVLDAAFHLSAADRILFSSKTGEGRENLLNKLDHLMA